MNTQIKQWSIKRLAGFINWRLLAFLVFFLDVKLPVKLAGIALVYLFQPDLKFGFSLKNSRLPLFYLLVIPIAFIALIINQSYQHTNYLLLFLTGIGFWLLCILAVHQIKLMVEKTDTEVIHRTITVFFILNAIVSILGLLLIIWETKHINPYTYRGMYQKYFINTGDNIKGISFDISSTNGALNVFGAVYFLVRKQYAMLLTCMVVLMLTTSNIITIILLATLLIYFVFNSSRDQKSIILICGMIFLIFMLRVSPENTGYLADNAKRAMHIPVDTSFKMDLPPVRITDRPDNTLNFEEKREKFATLYLDSLNRIINLHKPHASNGPILIPEPYKYAYEFRPDWIVRPEQQVLLDFISSHKTELPLSSKEYQFGFPGKLRAGIQTVSVLLHQPMDILTGLGIGNFSSKIAFRATGLGLRGNYPEGSTYINPAFMRNHLDVYLTYFSRWVGLHSVVNNPSSVYDQLLSEYGILGLLALLVCYLGFFARHYKRLTYGLPLVIIIAAFFFLDYWFEQLSIVVMFELMLFVNLKETALKLKTA